MYLSRSYWSIPPCNEPVFSYLAFIRSFSKESACSCLSTNMIDKPSPSSEPRTSNNLRNLPREELWIRNYQSIEFGANKHFWTFLYTFPKTWFHFQNGFSEWAFIFNMWFFFEMCFHFQNVKGFVMWVWAAESKATATAFASRSHRCSAHCKQKFWNVQRGVWTACKRGSHLTCE